MPNNNDDEDVFTTFPRLFNEVLGYDVTDLLYGYKTQQIVVVVYILLALTSFCKRINISFLRGSVIEGMRSIE